MILTRSQVLRLAALADKFPETDRFFLEESSSSGIGADVLVKFKAFNGLDQYDTTIDITDVEGW
jgi:hypothetical protein